jgi:hypothetical protein
MSFFGDFFKACIIGKGEATNANQKDTKEFIHSIVRLWVEFMKVMDINIELFKQKNSLQTFTFINLTFPCKPFCISV